MIFTLISRKIAQKFQIKIKNFQVNEIMSPVNLKFAGRKDEKNVNLNLAERIYRLQVIKQLIKERQIAHTAEDFNEGRIQLFLTNLTDFY
jgi:hypothetical protein